MTRIEALTKKYLKYIYPNEEVIYNLRPDWLKNPNTGYNLELDIYFPKLKLAVEVNGFTHRILESQKKRDNIKQFLCREKEVRLIKITHPYKLLKLFPGLVPKKLIKQVKYYKPRKIVGSKQIKYQGRMELYERLQSQEIIDNQLKTKATRV